MQAQGGPQFFYKATNPVINGGTFTSVTNVINSKINGLQLLLDNVSHGAFHDAAERGDPPKCHPRTRIAIRADIMEWIKAPNSMRKLILWMYGPAGSGKTAIAQSVAEECARLGLLAASFFFWRSAAGRNTANQFVATLAYQFSRYIPLIETHLIAAIERDPKIFTRALATQMRTLVIEPLKHITSSQLIPIAAIVDGVDECGPDGPAQSSLLHQLESAASELRHLPLVFIVSSRPEYDIREVFNENYLNSLTKVLVLDNKYKPDEDIKEYLDSEFDEICEKTRRQSSNLPSPWPNADEVNFLVSKASGQFIFASTIIKFVDSPRHDPVDRLNIVLRLSNVGNKTPFAPLDALYRFILGSVADVEKVLEILMLLFLKPYSINNMGDAEELLGFDIRRVLIDMHALLFVPPPTDNILPQIYHASLSDFLMDRSRSLEYYIDESHGHATLARRWLTIIECRAQSRFSTCRAVYAFVHHYEKSPPVKDLLDDLMCFDLRAFLNRSSDLQNDFYRTDWEHFIKCVNKQRGSRKDVFPFQNDLDTFILDRIGQYPQSFQPYIPILFLGWDETNDMLDILLHGVSKSVKEFNGLRKLDKRLLHLGSTPWIKNTQWVKYTAWINVLFRDATRAGKHFVHPGSYPSLVKTIVNAICTWPGERYYQIMFRKPVEQYFEDESNMTMRIGFERPSFPWFKEVLAQAQADLDLVNFLRERAVQFNSDINPKPGQKYIAEASVKYIKRCGIPFLAHTHPSYTNECAICMMCNGAVVLKAHGASSLLSTHQQPTSHAPSPLESNAHESTTAVFGHHEVAGTQVLSSSSFPPDEDHGVGTVSTPQSKRKRADTLTRPTPTCLLEGSQTGKRRKTRGRV